MSEVSDAITIVVSEQTGKIAITYDCEIIHDVTPEQLKTYLYERLAKQEAKDKA